MIKKIFSVLTIVATLVLISAPTAHAQGFLQNLFGGGGGGLFGGSSKGGGAGGGCGETKTHLISCESATGVGAIGDIIRTALVVITTLIGITAVGALAYAGMLYAAARDDREKVRQAVKIIRNVILGILFYVLTVAIINWLIPGSVIAPDPESSPVPSESVSPSPTPTQSPTQ